jgi:fatty acid desaturase
MTYTALHVMWPDLFRIRSFAGALVLYLALTELINLPHHSDMPFGFRARLRPWEQWRTARSCDYPRWIARAGLLNFNLHIEHHLFPALPWYRLERVRAELKPVLGEHYAEAVGAAWNVRNRGRDLQTVLLTKPTSPPT